MRGAILASRPPGRSTKLATQRFGRSPESLASRPNSLYRLQLPLEYINPLQARSPRRVGRSLSTAASLAASERVGALFFEGTGKKRRFLSVPGEKHRPSGHSRSRPTNRVERPHADRTVSPARRLLLSALFSRSYQREKNFKHLCGNYRRVTPNFQSRRISVK